MDGGTYSKIQHHEEHEPDNREETGMEEADAPRRINHDVDGVIRKDLQPMQLEESTTGWKRFSDGLSGHWDSFIRRPVLPFVVGFGLLFVMIVGIILGVLAQKSQSDKGVCEVTENWKGWGEIKHSFVLGDSYSATGFDHKKKQPSPANPLGNPAFPGITSCNATNWVGFLATKYNDSAFNTYNLAVGGASLDNNVVMAFPTSVADEIYNRFMPRYARYLEDPLWNPTDTLFTLFSGINDVIHINAITSPAELSTIFTNLELVHMKIFSALYGIGARNFLIMNVPPLERVGQPTLPPAISETIKAKFITDVTRYNTLLTHFTKTLKKKYPDINIFTYDIHTLFNTILDDPTTFEQTREIRNVSESCVAYALGTPTTSYLNPACSIPVNQYFWFATMHPTYPVHDVMAEQVAEALRSGVVSC